MSRHSTTPGLDAQDPDVVAEDAETHDLGFWASDQAVARVDAFAHSVGVVCIAMVVAGSAVLMAAVVLGLSVGDWTGQGNEFGAAMFKVAMFAIFGLIGGPVAFLWFIGASVGAIVGGQTISRFGWVVTVPWSLWVVWGLPIFGPLNDATADFLGSTAHLYGLSECLYAVGQHTVLWWVGTVVLSAGFFVLPVLNALDPKAPMNREDASDGSAAGSVVPRPVRLLRVVAGVLIVATVVLFVVGLAKGGSVNLIQATDDGPNAYRPMIVVAALSSLPPLGLLVLGLVGARLAAPHAALARLNPVWTTPRRLAWARRHEADDMGAGDDGTRPFVLAARADIGGGVALVVLMLIGVLTDVLPTVPTDSEYLWSPAMTSLQVITMSLAGAIAVAVVALLIVTVHRTHGRWDRLDPWLVASAVLLVLIVAHRAFSVFWLPDIIWSADTGADSWGVLDAWVRAGWGLALAYIVLRALFWMIEPARVRRAAG